MVDPFDVITETNENNNRALGWWWGTKPVITSIGSAMDDDPDPSTFGRFVSGVSLRNAFYANVADPDEDIDHVDFTLGPLGTERSYWWPDFGYVASFDVGQLSGDTPLPVIADDAQGHASDPWTGTVHVVPFPSWLGSEKNATVLRQPLRIVEVETGKTNTRG